MLFFREAGTVRNKYGILLGALLLSMFGWALLKPMPAAAQDEGEPVVYAVMFYSPTCGHCRKVITEDWPVMHEEFGDQFQVLFVNTSAEGGAQLYRAAVEALNVPEEDRGVPLMVLDSHVMIGDLQIPEEAPVLVREGLANGGIGLPDIPGLEESYQQAIAQATQQAAEAAESAEAAPTEVAQEAPAAEHPAPGQEEVVVEAEVPDEEALEADTTLSARLARDPLGNGLAVGVLIALAGTTGAIVVASLRSPVSWLSGEVGWRLTLAAALVALAVALTLLGGAAGGGLGLPMALGAAVCLAAAVVMIARHKTNLAVPLAALAGLFAAVYLAYVEVGQVEAICGVVGDCNSVQQSQYAVLFGLIPVGVLGLIGYLAMVFAWVLSWSNNPAIGNTARAALFGMAWFGVLFSMYLTFLEPFVIGATCAWCLTSALVMMLLFWLVAPAGLEALLGEKAKAA
jgi:uncharacterized membrane protein